MTLTGIGGRAARRLLVLFFCACCTAGRAADIPSVLVLGDDRGEGFARAVEQALAAKMLFYPLNEPFRVKYIPARPETAVRMLKGAEKENYRVLLVCLRDAEADVPGVGRLLKAASKAGLEVLWFGRDGGSASRGGVCVADYEGFCRNLKKDGDKPRAEYIAEAAAQWWAGIARSNRGVVRIGLWGGEPPHYEFKGPEYINALARIDRVSRPELTVFLPHQSSTAPAVLFFPGGGYSFTGFLRNVRELSELLVPRGVAVFGLKYRTKREAGIALEDACRAMRLVRTRAGEWNVDPDRVGVAGQSAGAHLVLSLATRYAEFDTPGSVSCRPDFAAPLTSWNFGKNDSPFVFTSQMPPFFVRQARNDSSFQLAERLVEQMQQAGVAVDWRFVGDGGHGAFEISGPGGGHDWPAEFLLWLEKRGIWQSAEQKTMN